MTTHRTNSRPGWSTRKKIIVAIVAILVFLFALVWVPRLFADNGDGDGEGGTNGGKVDSSSLILR